MQYANAAAVGDTSGIAVANSGTILAVATGSGGGSGWSPGELATFLGGDTTFAAGTALGIDTSNGDFTFAGDLGGAATAKGITKLGDHALTITGTNTYSGGTTISDGTLQSPASTPFPAARARAM